MPGRAPAVRPIDFHVVCLQENVILPELMIHGTPIVAFDAIELCGERLHVAVVTQLPTSLNLKCNRRKLEDNRKRTDMIGLAVVWREQAKQCTVMRIPVRNFGEIARFKDCARTPKIQFVVDG